MKRIVYSLLLALVMVCGVSLAQTYDRPGNYGLQYKRLAADSQFNLPIVSLSSPLAPSMPRPGNVVVNIDDNLPYMWVGYKWVSFAVQAGLYSYIPVVDIRYFGADTLTDATPAIQGAINWLSGVVETYNVSTGDVTLDSVRAPVSGKVFVPRGNWRLDRGLVKNVTHPRLGTKFVNSQLYIPLTSVFDTSTAPVQIEIVGQTKPGFLINYLNPLLWAKPSATSVSLLHSTISSDASSFPAMLRAVPGDTINPFSIPIALNPTEFHIENLVFEVHHDAADGVQLCGIDFYNSANFTVKNSLIQSDTDNYYTVAPVNKYYGIRTSSVGTGNIHVMENVGIGGGFWYGSVNSEHDILKNVDVFVCRIAFEIMTANYPIDFQNCLVHGCKYMISTGDFTLSLTNTASLLTGLLRVENNRTTPAGKWFLSAGVNDIVDSLNTLRGSITVEYDIDGTPAPRSLRFVGAKNLEVNTPSRYSSDSTLSTGFKTTYLSNLGWNMISRQTYGGLVVSSSNSLGEGYVVASGNRGGEFTNTVASFVAMTTKSSGNTGTRFSGKGVDWSFLFSYGTLNNGLAIGTDGAKPLVFGTTNLERGRFTPAGDLGIGTTTPLQFLGQTMTSRKVINITDSNASNYAGVFMQGGTGALFSMADMNATSGQRYFQFVNDNGLINLYAVNDAGSAINHKLASISLSTGAWHFGESTSARASALVEMTSTTKGFLPPRMTATQASAITVAAADEGLIVYVTNTNGTFTSKGWWGWSGAAWEKLNN